MGKKALRKDFYMAMKKSANRFLSIFAIVALGVAFYSGIRASAPDMRLSGDTYFDTSRLMDIKVMSPLGLTQEDVEALAKLDGIRKVEPGYMTDVYWGGSETAQVLRVESISPTLNQLRADTGRFPEAPGEIFVDIEFMQANDLALGDKIVLVEDTSEEETSVLKQDTYTLVGAGSSPLYISFTRGNTTLGTGELSGIAFILPEDFDYEVYTQIYLQVEGSETLTAYTDAYDDVIDRMLKAVENIAPERCQIRYDEVLAEAEEELADARQELADGKKEADEELADAWQDILDAEAELADGEQELADGLIELEDNEKLLQDKEAELADAKTELADAERELAEGAAEFEENEAKFNDEYPKAMEELMGAEAAVSKASGELSVGWAEYESGASQLADAQAQIDSGRQQLEAAKNTLNAGWAEYNAGAAELAAKEQELVNGENAFYGQLAAMGTSMEQIDALKSGYEGLKGGIDLQQAEIDALRQEQDGLTAIPDEERTQEQKDRIAALAGEIAAREAALESFQSTNNWSYIEAQWQQVAGLYDTLKNTEKQLTDGRTQLEQGKQLLASSRAELDAAQGRLQSEEAALLAAQKQIDEKRPQLEEAKKQLEAGQAQISENAKKLKDGRKELEDAKAELEDARTELWNAKVELEDAKAQLADGQQQLIDGRQELADAKTELQDAQTELADAKQELADGKLDYEEAKLEAQEEIADAEEKLADAEQELQDLEVPKWQVNGREVLTENVGYGENAERINNIGKVIPILFFLVAALISLTTMTRMVEEERTQIGTLKALGYSKLSIASKYLMYAVTATIGGSIVGMLIGEKLIPYVVIDAYGIMYAHMDTIRTPYQLSHGLFATGAALVCTVGATWAACSKSLAETPAVLMRPPAPKEGKRVFLERIGFIWNRLSFSWKSTIRNLMRYKKRVFMTIFGISGCMGLMIVGFGLRDSIMDIATLQYEQLQLYDVMTIGEDDVSAEEKAEIISAIETEDQVEAYASILMQNVTVPDGKKEHSMYIIVPEQTEGFEDFVCFRNRTTKETYTLAEEGVIVTEKIASMLEVEPGEELLLEDEDGVSYSVPVYEICENYMAHYLYMTPAYYTKIFGTEPAFDDIMLQTADMTEEEMQDIGERLLSHDGVLSVSYTGTIMDQLEHMLSALDMVIYVLIISAGLLAFVVLYNLNNININERKRELATLKVLGFFDGEVGAYIYRENVLLTLIGIVAGLLLGKLLHRFIIVTVEVDICMFGRNIEIPSYLISAAFTALFSFIVNWVMHYKLKKIDMVESLKSVE